MGNKRLQFVPMQKIDTVFECMYTSEAELNQKRRVTKLHIVSKRGLTCRINDAYVKGGRTSVFM